MAETQSLPQPKHELQDQHAEQLQDTEPPLQTKQDTEPPLQTKQVQPPALQQAQHNGTLQSFNELLERLRTVLYIIVEAEVDRVLHLEREWCRAEMIKRLVRYVYSAAKVQGLLTLPWREATVRIAEQAMLGYASGCQEKPWFFELDFVQALSSAAWEISQAAATACGQRPAYRELQETVMRVYEDSLDHSLLSKGLWDATQATFHEPGVRAKVNRALSKTHTRSLEECLMDSRPVEALKRVEAFTRRWMDSSMRQAWFAVEHAEDVLTERTMLRLFQHLVAPFGDQQPYSCIPPLLIERIGRPPSDWSFLETAVQQMLASWREESRRPSGYSKRRRTARGAEGAFLPSAAGPSGSDLYRKKALSAEQLTSAASTTLGGETIEVMDSGDEAASSVLPQTPRSQAPRETAGRELAELSAAAAATASPSAERLRGPQAGGPLLCSDGAERERRAERHRECTSAEDCVGRPGDFLVRHVMEDLEGDVYCESCWQGLFEENHTLRGLWEDGPWQGKPFQPGRPRLSGASSERGS